MEIKELQFENLPYVISIVCKRWGLSEEDAKLEIDRWMSKENHSICFVGFINGQPMATGVFDIISDVDYSIPCWNTLLWVEPEHRGNEYGKALIQKRFSWAKDHGYECVYLDTTNAKNYHLRFGWQVIREFDKDNECYTIMKYNFNKKIV